MPIIHKRATNAPGFCTSIFSHHPRAVRVEIPFNGNNIANGVVVGSGLRVKFLTEGSPRPLLHPIQALLHSHLQSDRIHQSSH